MEVEWVWVFDNKRCEDAIRAGQRRRSGMIGEVQRERERRGRERWLDDEKRGGGGERESPCRTQSSLTKNSTSSGNPVPQDMTI